MTEIARKPGQDLTEGPPGQLLRRQATPFALALLAIFSFEAIDLFFIAQLGDAQLAAVSFALPVIWLVYGIGIGFEAGAASCVSRAVGRKDEHQAGRLTTDTIVLGTLVALAICLLGLTTIYPVFRLLGAPDELLPMAHDYMIIWYWVAPMDVALWTMLASIRARGNTLLESKIIIASALINLVLDPIFIFGLFGFPRMEIAGAALATLVATGVMLLFSVWYLTFRLHVFAPLFAPLKEIFDSWRHMLQIGIPAVITNAIIPISSGVVVAMVAKYGVDAVAGLGIAMRIEPIALIPFYALSAVASPFFGQNSGAGAFDRMQEARRVLTRFSIGFGIILAMVTSLAAGPIAGWYTDSETIRGVTTAYVWIVSWSWGAYGLVMSANAAFNGSGRPMPGVVISSFRVIIVLLPLIWLGQKLIGLNGLFAAIAIANVLMGWVAYQWLGRHIIRMEARFGPISPQPMSGS